MLPQTVLEFTFIEFDTNWKRDPTPVGMSYTAIEPATLKVVAEDRNAVKQTYLFSVQPKEIVGVSFAENLVFIPARCTKREKGDTTKCIG